MASAKQYWLMKSEPEEFSIDDLARVRVEPWSGVRNFMARFHMRSMSIGDEVLFHHSSVDPPGVAGLARVVRTNVLDEKQFDPAGAYFDPRATRDKPIWDCVDVEFVAKFDHFVSMERLRTTPELANMLVLKRGMRLSVQPVTEHEYAHIVGLGATPPPPRSEPLPKAWTVAPRKRAATKRPAAKRAKAPAKRAKAPAKKGRRR